MTNSIHRFKAALPLALTASLILSACSSSDNDDAAANMLAEDGVFAFAATSAFPTGQIERISFADGYTVNGTYPATTNDIRVETFNNDLYQLGRFDLDSLTKFDVNDTSVVEYQYSLNGDESKTNPYDVVFASETKAYVIRYGSPKIIIIDPTAVDEASFIIGEIDTSAYDPDLTDEVPEPRASGGVIVGNQLFVLFERLSTTLFSPIEQGYVAVYDIETDTEVDTGKGEADQLMGIPLGSLNPGDIRFNEATGEVYVTGRGNIFVEFNMLPGDPYSGGLFAIDPTTYDLNQLLDDGDATTNTLGFIERTLVLNDEKGYVSFYASEAPAEGSRNTLYTFNPSTGIVGESVAALEGMQIATLDIGINGFLWVGISSQSAPGFLRLDTTSDTVVGELIRTDFSPLNVEFIDTTP